MIAIDTNILIRLLVYDDISQNKKAADLIAQYKDAGFIYVSDIVLVET